MRPTHLLLAAVAAISHAQTPAPRSPQPHQWPWLSAAAGPPSARARLLLAEMTLGEKITMLHGCQPVGKAPCGVRFSPPACLLRTMPSPPSF